MSEDLKLLKLPYSENYMQNRIDRFYEEFLQVDHSISDIEQLLSTIHDYLLLLDSGESSELAMTIINLRQSIFWLQTWTSDEYEDS